MRFKRLDQARPFATLAVILAAWLVLPAVVKSFARVTFHEFTAPLSVAASRVRDLQEYWALRLHTENELIEAGSELARLNSSYEFGVQQNASLRAEIARLENLLRLPSFPEYRYEHARVVRRDFTAWWQRIVIRKGRNFGLPVGAPVVFTGGAVGRVAEVNAFTSVVDLISSPAVRLAATVEGDARPVSFTGGPNPVFGPPVGVVESLPLDIIVTPSAGKRLVTYGPGGVFPPGLSLGVITHAAIGSDGLFQTGEVRLEERLGSLTEVTVLVPVNKE